MLLFGDTHEYSWTDALALATPGTQYRITQLGVTTARDRCRNLGLQQGDELVCVDNRRSAVHLARPDGLRVTLERDHAWFVQVEPVGGHGPRSPAGRG